MMRVFHRLRRDARGSATIELALVLPVLATFVMGAADVSMAIGRKLVVEQAAQRAVELIMQTTTDTTVEENIKEEAANAAGIDEANVTVAYNLECDGVDTTYSADCGAGEIEVRYITVTVTDEYEPLFLSVFPITNANGKIDITAQTGVRTH